MRTSASAEARPLSDTASVFACLRSWRKPAGVSPSSATRCEFATLRRQAMRIAHFRRVLERLACRHRATRDPRTQITRARHISKLQRASMRCMRREMLAATRRIRRSSRTSAAHERREPRVAKTRRRSRSLRSRSRTITSLFEIARQERKLILVAVPRRRRRSNANAIICAVVARQARSTYWRVQRPRRLPAAAKSDRTWRARLVAECQARRAPRRARRVTRSLRLAASASSSQPVPTRFLHVRTTRRI